jgi:hypothetical protein
MRLLRHIISQMGRLPYCPSLGRHTDSVPPLLGPSSLDGPGTGTKDDGKDSQWGPADEQTDDDNSTKQADPNNQCHTCHTLLAFPVVP